jgi:hypothetical protein
MKPVLWLGLFLLLFAAACQPSVPTPTAEPQQIEATPSQPPVPTVALTETAEPEVEPAPTEPSETESYPAPVSPATTRSAAYPEPSEEISWDEAEGLILEGQVAQVFQSHLLRVVLVLKDGRTIETVEPAIDEVFRAIEACGDPCADVVQITE